MEPSVVFVAVLVLLEAAVRAVGELPAGSLSIDCGLDENDVGNYSDTLDNITYVPDGPYVDTGKNFKVDADHQGSWGPNYRTLRTLRSFPSASGERNCYMLPTVIGAKYLVRMEFLYGNYDHENSQSLEFNLTIGVNPWDTVNLNTSDDNDGYRAYEAIFVAWASWAPVCLVNTDGGTPFVSTVELRPLGSLPYPAQMGYQSMALYQRWSMGPSRDAIRYPDDVYDRYWYSLNNPSYSKIDSPGRIPESASFAVPSAVLQTAFVPDGNNTTLTFIPSRDTTHENLMVFLHYADFQKMEHREFDAYFNDEKLGTYFPMYMIAVSNSSARWTWANEDGYNLTLAANPASKLPPIINAFEVYGLISHDSPTTLFQDFDAIMAIKYEYGIKKKTWMGDPCFPPESVWEGVKCSYPSGNNSRIISLDLSNSNLQGSISNNFKLLTALQYLNLSGNQLKGSIPDSLCKNNGLSFDFSYNSDGLMCNKTSPSSSSNRIAILIVSITVPLLVVAILGVAYLTWRAKRKPKNSTNDNPREPELMGAIGSKKNHWKHMQKPENRQFTYDELEKLTDNFKRLIGHGGFGHVYYGCLEDNTEVAVKMRSESSSHGLDEFIAEVKSLTKVHHKNLVYLVGYCWEKDHLALVYEYMSQGNLGDYLRGKTGVDEPMNWVTRVRVVLEAAQGLDYLHKGCSLPIIHSDVKTNNILLGPNLKAKIADFGLSKTYHKDSQTHISATAAGSVGYMDPEYYYTSRLTESSDVYGFGVVLLEVVTGEPPILPGKGHIVQRVKQKIVAGNINSIADARLKGAFDISSMWKVVDTAMLCTADIAAQRPTMATVVVQLKESLTLEEVHVDRGNLENPARDTTSSMSTFGPSPR